MKIIKLSTIFFLIGTFLSVPLQAQVIQPAGKLDVNVKPGGQVAEISTPFNGVRGTYYLIDDWQVGNVYLYAGQKVESITLKYDIQKERLELNTTVGLRTIEGDKIDYFELYELQGNFTKKRVFTNIKNFKHNLPLPVIGFFELMNVEGEHKLLVSYEIQLKDGYYVPALDAGSKEPQVVKSEKLYFWIDGELRPIGKKKEVFSLFGDMGSQLEKYAKQHKLNPRRKMDLLPLIQKYNELKGA